MANRHAKAPISAHPLFPAVVAVWFAALFGLGSGVLPNVLFERFFGLTGISELFPAAAPPLGVTFRILLSLSFGIAGALAGFVLARRLAASQAVDRPVSAVSRLSPRPDPRPASDEKRRPISVDDLGDTRLDPDRSDDEAPNGTPIPGRRRALAMAEDERRSDFFTDAPVTMPQPQPQEPPRETPTMEQPLDLSHFVAPEPEPVEDPAYVAQAEPRIEPDSIVDRGLQGLRNRSPFARPFGDEGAPPAAIEPPFAAPGAVEPVEAEPLPFSAPSQAAPQPESERQVFQPAPERTVEPATAPAPMPEPMQVFAAAAEMPAPILPTDPLADLSDLGMVQLAERLAASLRNRLERPAVTPAFAAGLKADFGIEIEAEVAAEIAPGSAIFGGAGFAPVAPDAPPPPPVIPAALRPFPLELAGDDDDDEEDPLPSLSLPLAGRSFLPADADEDEEFDDIGETEENYSSLLAMRNPFRGPGEFVRIEEPEPEDGEIEPAVVFPGEAPLDASPAPFAAPGANLPVTPAPAPGLSAEKPDLRPFDAPANAGAERRKADPEETERALRSALATLQRMSGAA